MGLAGNQDMVGGAGWQSGHGGWGWLGWQSGHGGWGWLAMQSVQDIVGGARVLSPVQALVCVHKS